MADSNESPPPYSLTSEAVKFGKNPDGTPIILETPTERMAT